VANDKEIYRRRIAEEMSVSIYGLMKNLGCGGVSEEEMVAARQLLG
jgi:hypothetical protein